MNVIRFKSIVLNLLLALLIIFAPSNLFLVLCHGCGYVNGLQSDYLIPKLYLVDLIMVALGVVGFWIIQPWKNRNYKVTKKTWFNQQKTLAILLVILMVRQWWAPFPMVAVWNLAEWFLIGVVGWVLFVPSLQHTVKKNVVIGAVAMALLLQTGVGLYQSVFQKSLFNYKILGETQIQHLVGIATTETTFEKKLAPYGTTAHPNILAGFVAGYSILLITWLIETKVSKKVTLLVWLAIGSSWLVLGLTQSLSGASVLVTGGAILLMRNTSIKIKSKTQLHSLITLLVFIFLTGPLTFLLPNQSLSVHRRQYLLQTSWQMTANNWLWGSGLNNFTALAEKYSPTTEVVRFNQPVHHMGWLWVAETGLLGLVVFLLLLSLIKDDTEKLSRLTIALVFLLPVLVWDHYLLSLENGRLLLLLLLQQSWEVRDLGSATD